MKARPGNADRGKVDRMRDLVSFDRYNSPAGLLRRYASGRLRALMERLSVALIGTVAVAIFISPLMAALLFALTVLLELIEAWVLRDALRRDRFDAPATGRRIKAATVVQTMGLAVPISVIGLYGEEMRLLAVAFLIGGVLNSGNSARYHPASHRLRMIILGGTSVAIILSALLSGQISPRGFVVEMVAFAAMAYMMAQLFRHRSRRDRRFAKAERELITTSTNARRLAVVAEYATDSVTIMDRDRRVTWVNPQFTRANGYTLAEISGKRPGELLAHPDEDPAVEERFSSAATAQRSLRELVFNIKKNGETAWVEVEQSPIYDEDGEHTGFVSVERDATEAVAQREQLKQALRAARNADEAKSAFLSRMSHELRTPANGILGSIDLLRGGTLTPDQKEEVAALEQSSARLVALIDDLLSFSDGKVSAPPINMAEVHLGVLVNEVADPFRMVAATRNLTLTVEQSGLPEAPVRTDGVVVGRVLEKLLDNAIKFSDAGEVRLTVTAPTPCRIRVEVSDSGAGIAPEDQDRIFRRFEQVDSALSRSQDGAGLGLPLARAFAQALGGDVSVTSEVGKGSTFVFEFPVAAAASELCSEMKLLVAEDNRVNRMLIEKMFKGAPQRLIFAKDGQEAVEKYRAMPPDIVLMDISMPRKDGIEATRDIRRLEVEGGLRRCPIVAVTANVSDDDRNRCFEAGMDGFVTKPVGKAKLMEAIGAAVG